MTGIWTLFSSWFSQDLVSGSSFLIQKSSWLFDRNLKIPSILARLFAMTKAERERDLGLVYILPVIVWSYVKRYCTFIMYILLTTHSQVCNNFLQLKNDEKCFYFILKALFIVKIFKSLSWLFGHVEKWVD